MRYSVRIAQPAIDEIEHAIGYIASKLGQSDAAAALADEIELKLDSIAENPRLYGVNSNISARLGVQVRRCPVKGYALRFVLNRSRDSVDIVAFLHGSQDAPRHLSQRL